MLAKKHLASVSLIAASIIVTSSLPLNVFAQDATPTKAPSEVYYARLTQQAQKRELYREEYEAKLTQAAEQKEEYREEYRAHLTQAAEQKNEYLDNIEENREQTLAAVQERLAQQIDKTINHLETLKTRIDQSTGLTDLQKTNAVAELDSYIVELLGAKDTIMTAETLESLKGIGTFTRELWQDYGQEHRRYVGLHLVGRFQEFVGKLEVIAEQVETRLNELAATTNLDLSEAQLALTNFQTSIDTAYTLINQAEAQFLSIGQEGVDHYAAFQNGMSLLRQAKAGLHNAHSELRVAVAHLQEQVTSLQEDTL